MKKIVLFGAGDIAKKLLNYPIRNDVKLFVVDNNSERWGEQFGEFTIENPDKLIELEFDFVIITSTVYQYIEEILSQLTDYGIKREKIIFANAIFTMDYFEGELDEFFIIEKKPLIPFKKGPAEIYQDYVGETFKSHSRREKEGFFEKYCQGEGLDIGYGADIIVPGCSGWDLRNGDAQYLYGIEDESFDFVYSSHCLEHVLDVRIALKNWFRVVRKGGYLIIAIPHRDLYEKKNRLPSRWNLDHKHMFLIGKEEYPDTLDIIKEIKESLCGYDIKYVKTCDEGHTIDDPYKHSNGEYQIELVLKKIQ